MVIQTKIHDGISIRTRTYRNIIKNVNLVEFKENFLSQRSYCKWGEMIQLKGNDRIILASFGKIEKYGC